MPSQKIQYHKITEMVDSLKERLLPKSMSESIYSVDATARTGMGVPPSVRRSVKAAPVYEPHPPSQIVQTHKDLNNSINDLDRLVKSRGEAQVDMEP